MLILKIGVLTYHRSHNYGAYLQAYALVNWIKEFTGDEVELIDYNMVSAEKFYIKEVLRGKSILRIISNFRRYCMFKFKAIHDLPVSSATLISNNIDKFSKYVANNYDIIVVGSDEVWKLGFRGFPNPYWLPKNSGCIKVSYAASARSDFTQLSEENQMRLKKYLYDFQYIGVRDRITLESISQFCSQRTYLNCDPTFNYDFKFNKQKGINYLTNKCSIDPSKKCIAFMFSEAKLAIDIMKHYGNKFNYIALYDAIPGAINICNITPFQWIDILACCDFLVTTYFHGMCFAIKSNVPFIVMEIRGGEKEESKSYDLLEECQMEERFFLKSDINLLKSICAIIERDIIRDIDFSEAVKKQKEKAVSFIDALNTFKSG